MRLLLTGFILALSSAFPVSWAQGPLTPPSGSPEPVMRTLDEVEPRIPIDSVPILIDQPGSYYFTGNLDAGTNTAVEITVPDVSLDLMGFTLSGTGEDGIIVNGPAGGTLPSGTIHNGRIRGFSVGVRLHNSSGALIEDIHITDASIALWIASSVAGAKTKGNMIRHCVLANNGAGIFFRAASGTEITGNRITDTIIMDNDADGIGWHTTGGKILNNVIAGCTVSGNGHAGNNTYGIHFRPDGGKISGNRIEDCTIVFNRARAFYVNPRISAVVKNQLLRGNAMHNHDDAGILIGVSTSVGAVDSVHIEDNTLSWNGFNGGVKSNDGSSLDVRHMNVVYNVFADNGVQSVLANLTIYSDRGTVYGNHVSGASTHGLNINDASRMVVAKNSVFGETFTITGDSTYGPIVEALPVPNNSWANFRLE